MQSPIFIVDAGGSDLSAYASTNEAQIALEAIDVRNECFIGYDSEGRLLKFSTEGDQVSIALAEEQPAHKLDLMKALNEYLVLVGKPPPDPDNLSNLIHTFRLLIGLRKVTRHE